MLFFRSEEHLRNWARFDPETEEGIFPLPDLVKLFSIDFFRRRMDSDYITNMHEYMGGFITALMEIGKTGSFWLPG